MHQCGWPEDVGLMQKRDSEGGKGKNGCIPAPSAVLHGVGAHGAGSGAFSIGSRYTEKQRSVSVSGVVGDAEWWPCLVFSGCPHEPGLPLPRHQALPSCLPLFCEMWGDARPLPRALPFGGCLGFLPFSFFLPFFFHPYISVSTTKVRKTNQ